MAGESTRKVVECNGQYLGVQMSRTGLTVVEWLTTDTISTRCSVTNMPHPRGVKEWDVTANLYCLQYDPCNAWLEGLVSFEQLYARAIGMLRKTNCDEVGGYGRDWEGVGKV